jgi:hypothetical protein
LAMVMSGRKVFGIAGAAQAARILIGPWGGALIAVAACVSTSYNQYLWMHHLNGDAAYLPV